MSLPNTLTFGGVVITIQGAAGGQVAPCGFLKKSVKFASQTSDTIVPDCTDPDLPAWLERNIVSLSVEVQGSGVCAMENTPDWRAFWTGGVSLPCVINFNSPGSLGGFTVSVNMVCSDWSLDVDRKSEGGRVQQSVTLMSDGAATFTPNAG